MADQGTTQLAHLDPTLYTQCFSGQAKEGCSWCQHCHSLEHGSESCPLKPPTPKRPKPTTAEAGTSGPSHQSGKDNQVCRNFNSTTGCKYGKRCRRIHRCLGCRGPHPQVNCTRNQGDSHSICLVHWQQTPKTAWPIKATCTQHIIYNPPRCGHNRRSPPFQCLIAPSLLAISMLYTSARFHIILSLSDTSLLSPTR